MSINFEVNDSEFLENIFTRFHKDVISCSSFSATMWCYPLSKEYISPARWHEHVRNVNYLEINHALMQWQTCYRIVTIQNFGNVLNSLRENLYLCQVNDCIGENNITDMWWTYFSDLLNSVSDNTNKLHVEHFWMLFSNDMI